MRARADAKDDRRRKVVGEHRAWMVERSETGEFGTPWFQGHGLSVVSETLGPSSRLSRPAPSLQMQSDEPVVASSGPRQDGDFDRAVVPAATSMFSGKRKRLLTVDWRASGT